MKKWLFAILLGSAIVLGACGGGDDDGAKDNGTEDGAVETADAEALFKKSCASCHGGDLTGGMGPNLTAVGADYSADEIEDIIENGIRTMPAQNKVSPEDRTVLADWLSEKK